MQRISFLDYRLTLGHAATADDIGRMPELALGLPSHFGVVRYKGEQGGTTREMHELYGYDPTEYRWVLLGSLDVGALRTNVPVKRTIATIMFIPALAVDASVLLLSVAAAAYGAQSSPLDPIGFSDPTLFWDYRPHPVDFDERGVVPEIPILDPWATCGVPTGLDRSSESLTARSRGRGEPAPKPGPGSAGILGLHEPAPARAPG